MILILFSCGGTKESFVKNFVIVNIDSLENYYVYTSKTNGIRDNLKLLSPRFNCTTNKSVKIIENGKYKFDVRETVFIKLVDTFVNTSLIRGLTVDDIIISKPNKLPYLIINSCNGYLTE
jgi:hypothetical protein